MSDAKPCAAAGGERTASTVVPDAFVPDAFRTRASVKAIYMTALFMSALFMSALFAAALFMTAALAVTPVWAAEPGAPREDEASITLREGDFDIDVRYPRLGQAAVDDDLARWAAHVVAAFRQGLAEPDDAARPATGTSDPNAHHFVNELKVTYEVTRASARAERAVTVVFNVWTYTGGAHGNLDIITLSYDTASGTRLTLESLFADTEGALALLAAYCYDELAESLGDARVEDMLRGGTSPDADNYASLALTPEGLRVYFPPYQVAPWSAGPQQVDVPLGVLIDAGPKLELWGVKP